MPDAVRFEVLGRVPSGPSGAVWKARDTGLDRIVALKEVTGQNPAEAQALAALSSPHVVAVYGVVQDAARVYLVEEWIDGATLAEVLRINGQLSTGQALAVLRGALLGLADAHRAGLVHGDVSASNILVDATGTSKLVDLGSVVRAGERARSSTGAYAAPEVLAGGSAVPASDVYAAAAVLATLLHGRREPRPSTRGIEGEVRPVLDRALDGNPAGRYRDAAEFLAALEEAARRRYGPGWFTDAGLGALATAATAGLVTAGLAAVPFAAGATMAGAGTPAAGSDPFTGVNPFASATPPTEPDPFGGPNPFARSAARSVSRSKRFGLLAGGGVLAGAAVAIVLALTSGGGGHKKPAAAILTPTPTPTPTLPLSAPRTTPSAPPRPSNPPTAAPTTTASATPSAPSTTAALDVPLTTGRVSVGYQVLKQCDGCDALTPSAVVVLDRIAPGYVQDDLMGAAAYTAEPGTGDAFDIGAPFGVADYRVVSEEPGQQVLLTISVRIPYLDPAVNERSPQFLVIGGTGQAAPSDGCTVSIATADANGFSGHAECPQLSVADGRYVVTVDASFAFTP